MSTRSFLPQAVLFDLDGTLLDTADDLGAALNDIMQKLGKSQVAAEAYRPIASNGASGLLALGFGVETTAPIVDEHRQAFLDSYHDNIAALTTPYNGILSLIQFLKENDINWGIITNKPEGLTHRLFKELALFQDCPVMLGGDSLPERKPSPLPLRVAAETINVAPESCWYVGDAPRDIESANAAGMFSVIAGWGYINAYAPTETWQADIEFETVEDLQSELSRLLQIR